MSCRPGYTSCNIQINVNTLTQAHSVWVKSYSIINTMQYYVITQEVVVPYRRVRSIHISFTGWIQYCSICRQLSTLEVNNGRQAECAQVSSKWCQHILRFVLSSFRERQIVGNLYENLQQQTRQKEERKKNREEGWVGLGQDKRKSVNRQTDDSFIVILRQCSARPKEIDVSCAR